ncbi:putative multidrug resistance protein EmrK [Acaryochloris thomasi RCC1774]|uniref:Putative multidrug resistance protein EmrK n=1 Tax=Acaryochloris thomasi RCC1774 TaxID=1764569 RepID=A0A2W1JV24_9CYAN|nr:HlyD family efflux transporter periplasmic adaptor subunit [Acaryochloris thomasi]PZD72641.1 putative multidrug resistance protein EmrK [Acaryochloris thomasi RCC1774]
MLPLSFLPIPLKAIGLLTIGLSPLIFSCGQLKEPPTKAQEVKAPTAVVARGKIIPQWDVIKLSVPNAEDSRVNRIMVKEGDRVQANQVIAILQGADRRLADLKAARANVSLLQARLKKAKQTDAKPGAISAQQAVIERLNVQLPAERKQLQAELASAQSTLQEASLAYGRRQMLLQEGAINKAELEAARQDFETAQATVAARQAALEKIDTTLNAQIREEKARLADLQQVRPVDVSIAQAELQQALIEVEQRQADLEDTQVRAPIGGQILRINTKVGEQVNTQLGIVELGRTQQMYVQAEVYETDLAKVSEGQQATMISEYGGFAGEIQGQIETVALQIGQPTIAADETNPTTDDNARVVNVSIRIDPDDNEKVSGLTNMQVRVTIALASDRP